MTETKVIKEFFWNTVTSSQFTIERKGWDSLEFNSDSNVTNINVKDLGFTLSRGVFELPIVARNYEANRQLFSSICSELIAHTSPDIPKELLNREFDDRLVEGVTPDLIFFGVNSDLISEVWEFKSSLKPYDDITMKKMIDGLKAKYGSRFDNVKISYTVLDRDFPDNFKAGPNFKKIYSIILSSIWDFINSKEAKQSRFVKNELNRPFPHLTQLTNDFLKIDYGESISKKIEDYSIETFSLEMLDAVEKLIPWFDDNYLVQDDAAEEMFSFLKGKLPTISSKHPWDRDKNAEFNQSTKECFGHRASYLFDFPLTNQLIAGEKSVQTYLPRIRRVVKSMKDNDDNVQSSVAYIAKRVLSLAVKNSTALDRVRDLQRELAFNLTERKKSEILESSKDTKIEDDIVRIRENIKEATKEIKIKFEDVKITSSGYIRFPLRKQDKYFTGINRDANKFAKVEDDHIDFENLEFDFDSLINNLINGPGFKAELKDFYTSNNNINEHCNSLLLSSQTKLDLLMSTPMFGYLYYTQKLYRGYLSQFPKMVTKKMQNGDFGFYAVKNLPIFVMSTAPPKSITSGLIVTFSVMEPGSRLPQGFIPHWYIDEPDITIAISHPYRINLKSMERFEETITSWLGLNIFGMNYGTDFYKNNFFNSFYLRYTRQLNQVLDASYLLLKNAINYGSIGRKEYKKKFEKLVIRDVRVGLVVKNLLQNYRKFVVEMVDFNKAILTQRLKTKDPIFGIAHDSFQSLLTIIYFRQIYPKHDGFDEQDVAFKFFVEEVEHQKDFDESRFNPNVFSVFENIDMNKFMEMLINEDGSWQKIAYHPKSCKFVVKQLASESFNKNPALLANSNLEDKILTETSVNSRVNIPDKLNLEGLKKKDKEKNLGEGSAGKYSGLQSIPLPEALNIEVHHFKEFAKAAFNLKDEDLDNYSPTLSDVLIYELKVFPRHAILTTKVKEQKGYQKRIFFIQTIDNRNLNKLMDESLNGLLKNTIEDMIVIPGDFKLNDLEDKMRKLGLDFSKGLIITEDQTRYGDMYPIESFDILVDTLYDVGYYDKPQRDLFREALNRLKGRVTLAPPNSSKLLEVLNESVKKNKKKLDNLSSKMHEKLQEKARLLRQIISDIRVWEEFDNDFIKLLRQAEEENNKLPVEERIENLSETIEAWVDIQENLAIHKRLGFVLGVFNKLGSTYSAAHLKAASIVIEWLGLVNGILGATHSDDSLKLLGIPALSTKNLVTKDINKSLIKLLRLFRQGWKLRGNAVTKTVVIFKPTIRDPKTGIKPEEKEFLVNGNVLVKFVALLNLVTPRLFGQRPSLTKWGIGPAGEVLQVFALGGKMIAPIMRWANAIGADLPGKSPSIDLSTAVSRVYTVFVNGGPVTLINDLEIVANWFVWQRYGIEPEDYGRINELVPELGGFSYFFPPLLLEQGFAANEIRLLSNAVSGNDFIKNQMILMMDTDLVFKQKEIFVTNLEDTISNTETEINISSEQFEGVVSSRKTFEINFVRNLKTLNSFFALFKKFEPFINRESLRYLKLGFITKRDYELFLRKKRSSDKIKVLKQALVPRILAKTGGALESTVSFLSRYLTKTFQEAYLRVPDGVMLTNRLGWMRRLFSNPFSKDFKGKDERFRKESYTIKEIWDIIIEMSNTGIDLSSTINHTFFRSLVGLWRDQINILRGFTVNFNFGQRKDFHDKEVDFNWVKLTPVLSAPIITASPQLMLSLALQNKIFALPFDQLPTVISNPWMINNANIRNSLDKFLGFINSLKFEAFDIIKHANVLGKIFQPRGLSSIIRLITQNETSPMRSIILENWNYNTRRSGKIDIVETNFEITDGKQEFTLGQMTKILAVSTSLATLSNQTLSSVVVRENKNIISLESIANEILKRLREKLIIGSVSYNAWLASMIFLLNQQNIINSTLSDSDKKENLNIFFYKSKTQDGIHGVRVINKNNFEDFFYLFEENGLKDSGEIDYIGYTNDSIPSRITFFLFLASFFLTPSANRITNLNQFTRQKLGNFHITGNTSMNFSTLGNIGIFQERTEVVRSRTIGVPFSTFDKLSFSLPNFSKDGKEITPYVITVWNVVQDITNLTFEIDCQKFVDDNKAILGLEPELIDTLVFTHPKNNSEFKIKSKDRGVQDKLWRRIILIYETIRSNLGLKWSVLDIEKVDLTPSEYADVMRILHYGGINIFNVKQISNLKFDIKFNPIAIANAKSISDRFEFTSSDEKTIMVRLSSLLTVFKNRYTNSNEIIIFFASQILLDGTLTPEKLFPKIKPWFRQDIDFESMELLLVQKSQIEFTSKFSGFQWGPPRPLSNGYFVSLISLINPRWNRLSTSLVERNLGGFWNGNMILNMRGLFKNSNNNIISQLVKVINFVQL